MESSKNGRLIITFKKFGMVRVKSLTNSLSLVSLWTESETFMITDTW